MTAPNVRNDASSNGPQLASSDVAEYETVIRADWGGLVCRREWGGEWEIFNLASITGNPMNMPVDSTDEHYRLAVMPEKNDNAVHVAGNLHGDHPRRYVICTDPTDWTNPASWIVGNARINEDLYGPATNPQYGYNNWDRFSDGTLLWEFSQGDREFDAASPYIGRDRCLFKLEVGETTWVPLDGATGEVMITDEVDDGADPERAYMSQIFIDADDVVHYWGHWDNGPLVQVDRGDPFYMRRQTDGTWETVDGTPVTLPISHASAQTYSNLNMPIDVLTSTPSSFYPAIDSDGHPHIVLLRADNVAFHTYWDGTEWVVENENGETPYRMRGLINIRGDLWTFRAATQGGIARLRLQNLTTGAVVTCTEPGWPVPFDPFPDPIRAKQGVLAISVPDGDLPRVFTFGDHARIAAAP